MWLIVSVLVFGVVLWALPWMFLLALLPVLFMWGWYLTWRDHRRVNRRYGRKVV